MISDVSQKNVDRYISASCQYSLIDDDRFLARTILSRRLKEKVEQAGYQVPGGFDEYVIFDTCRNRKALVARIYISDLLWLMKITV